MSTECDWYDDGIEFGDDEYCYQRVDHRSYYQGFGTTSPWNFPYRYWFELEAGTGACLETGFYCSRNEHCEGPDCPGTYDGFDGIDGISPEDYDACMQDLEDLNPFCVY